MNGDVFLPGQRPVTMPRERLLSLLDELRAMIAADDSMEGSLAYEWGEQPGTYNVACALRTCNSMGQGGMIFLGDNGPAD